MFHKETLNFDRITIKKHKFHSSQKLIEINNVDNKHSFGKNCFKYFVGYKSFDHNLILLDIKLTKLNRYVTIFEETKHMTFSLDKT